MTMVKFREFSDGVVWDERLGWLVDIECSKCGKEGKTSVDITIVIEDDEDIVCVGCGMDYE